MTASLRSFSSALAIGALVAVTPTRAHASDTGRSLVIAGTATLVSTYVLQLTVSIGTMSRWPGYVPIVGPIRAVIASATFNCSGDVFCSTANRALVVGGVFATAAQVTGLVLLGVGLGMSPDASRPVSSATGASAQSTSQFVLAPGSLSWSMRW